MSLPLRYNGQNIDASWFNAIKDEIDQGLLPSTTITVADSPYTPLGSDSIIYCDTSGGAITVNLPLSVNNAERKLYFKKVSLNDSNRVQITRTSPDLVDGLSHIDLQIPNEGALFHADGVSSWKVLSSVNIPNIKFSTKTSNFTITDLRNDHQLIKADSTSGAFTITLPAAASNFGKVLTIKKVSSDVNKVTIDANGSETIDGLLDHPLYIFNDTVTIYCDGSNWVVISEALIHKKRFRNVTSNYTISDNPIDDDVLFVSTAGGDVTITLPGLIVGRELFIKKTAGTTGRVVFNPGANTIDGLNNIYLYGIYDSVHLYCDGSNWFVIGSDIARIQQLITVTTTATLNPTYPFTLASSAIGGFTLTLPLSASVANHVYTVKKTNNTNSVTLTCSGGELIDGFADYRLTGQFDSVSFVPNGSGYTIVGTGNNQGTFRTRTANYTVDNNPSIDKVIFVDTGSGNITITMPTLQSGRRLTIKKISSDINRVIISAADLIDNQATSYLATFNESVTLYCNGTTWYVEASHNQKKDFYVTLSANTSLGDIFNDQVFVYVDTTSGNITINLPVLANNYGRKVYIKKISNDSNQMIIATPGTEKIDGSDTLTATLQYHAFILHAMATEWRIF